MFRNLGLTFFFEEREEIVSEMLGHRVCASLALFGNAELFPKVIVPVYIPINSPL